MHSQFVLRVSSHGQLVQTAPWECHGEGQWNQAAVTPPLHQHPLSAPTNNPPMMKSINRGQRSLIRSKVTQRVYKKP